MKVCQRNFILMRIIHVFSKIYSPLEVKEPDYIKGKAIEVYNFKKSDIVYGKLKSYLLS